MGKPVFTDGKVHVQKRMCDTCIFRPGNLMHLEEGRVESMVAETQMSVGGNIPCHKTTHGQKQQQAVCRGFFDRHSTPLLQIAHRIGVVEFVE